MSERRLLALLGLLIGLLAALLLLIGIRLPRSNEPFADWFAKFAIVVILGLAAIVGSLIMYGGKYQAGGIINIVMGIASILLASTTAGILLVFSGILGLVAGGTVDRYVR